MEDTLNSLKIYLQEKIDNGYHKLFYSELDFDIKTIDCINAIDDLQQERNNYKELYEKEKEKWEALKQKTINLFNRSQDICYLNILEIMQEIESRNK